MRRNNLGWWLKSSFRCTKRQKQWEPHNTLKILAKSEVYGWLLRSNRQLAFSKCNTKRFTWRRRNPEIQCHLDFFLISVSLISTTSRADILPGFKTNHSLITLHLTNNTNPRGPGFWKLNTSLLSDEEYIDLIKKTIKEVVNESKTTMRWTPLSYGIRWKWKFDQAHSITQKKGTLNKIPGKSFRQRHCIPWKKTK